jgi:hypothetical protein
MKRRILQVVWSDRETTAEIRKRTNTEDIVTVTHSVKWKWGGHVAGIDQRAWAHAASMWDVRIGKRRTGERRRDGQTVQESSRRAMVTNSQNPARKE